MRKYLRTVLCMALILGMCSPKQVRADVTATEREAQKADDAVVIEEEDKPYLSFGADLTPGQQETVLELMGIQMEELDKYDVTYVTNAQEHEYLDAYISSGEIGTRAWSSVVIVEREKGSGIHITTKNIDYCTIGMYKNALVTAGIEDADIIVAGPQMISGTAALVGIFKAYTNMTGDDISEEHVDTALNELVLTGRLEEIEGVEAEDVEAMVAYLKQQVASGALEDENSISTAIDTTCEEFDITLTPEEKSQLIDLMLKIKDLDLDADSLIEQAESVYDKIKDMGFEDLKSDGLWDKIGNFFKKLMNGIKDFFAGLFS